MASAPDDQVIAELSELKFMIDVCDEGGGRRVEVDFYLPFNYPESSPIVACRFRGTAHDHT